jgi:hypothetical protein
MKLSQIKVGVTYGVKKRSRKKCANFQMSGGKFVRVRSVNYKSNNRLSYDILNAKEEKIDFCFGCLKPSDLLPLKIKKGWKVGDVLANEVFCVDFNRSVENVVTPRAVTVRIVNVRTVKQYQTTLVNTDRVDLTWNTKEEIQAHGYKLQTKLPIVELTIDEIAEKFGVSVEELKIKK